jgi:hypothetical protein
MQVKSYIIFNFLERTISLLLRQKQKFEKYFL